MTPLRTCRRVLVAAASAAAYAALLTPLVRAEQSGDKTKQVGAMTVQYKVVLPNGYDPAKAYPAILVFGGGPQTMNTVDGALNNNFREQAEKRGYIVIGVAAPEGQLFFDN